MSEPLSTANTLRREHRIIERILRVLRAHVDRFERDGTFPADDLRDCVKFFRLFADACHHGKEEDLLFPVLEEHGMSHDSGPIAVMLYEHRMGRSFVKKMADELDAHARGEDKAPIRFAFAAKEYVNLLVHHIYKEDNVLFVMGERSISNEAEQRLCGKFCNADCGQFEGHTRDELEKLADEIERRAAR
jgi:hemerythrin-like domain-containing protein